MNETKKLIATCEENIEAIKIEIENTQEYIDSVKDDIDEKKSEIDSFDKSEHLTEERYDEMLDDVYGTVTIAGMEFDTSRALYDLDPTAYRCGMSDYADSLEYTDFEEYKTLEEELQELEDELSNYESNLESLEEDLQDEENSLEELEEVLAEEEAEEDE